MKKLSFLIVITIITTAFMPTESLAQARITSVTIGSGQSAVTSGLSGIMTLESTDGTQYGEFAVMQDFAWVAYGWNLRGRIKGFAAMSTGIALGAPWAGPYVALGTDVGPVSLGAYGWPTWLVKSPDGIPSETPVAHIFGASVTYSVLKVSFDYNKFLDGEWNSLPGIGVTLPVSENLDFTTSVTHNGNEDRLMYYLGATVSL